MRTMLLALSLALAGPSLASSPASSFDETPLLLAAATRPDNTAERRDARSRLFREVVPEIEASGLPASARDERGMLAALGDTPCAGGRLRIAQALVLGDAARVSIAGAGGGCSALMMRDGDAWRFVMILGWTLR